MIESRRMDILLLIVYSHITFDNVMGRRSYFLRSRLYDSFDFLRAGKLKSIQIGNTVFGPWYSGDHFEPLQFGVYLTEITVLEQVR